MRKRTEHLNVGPRRQSRSCQPRKYVCIQLAHMLPLIMEKSGGLACGEGQFTVNFRVHLTHVFITWTISISA